MIKVTQPKRPSSFQNLIARIMKKKSSNTNIMGNNEFAAMQAKRDEMLNALLNELEPVCGDAQAKDIINTIRLAQRGQTVVECLPVMALGETLAFIRNEVRKAIKDVKACTSQGNVVDFDAERAKQRCEQMVAVYRMVMSSYYTLYGRFMTAMKTSAF